MIKTIVTVDPQILKPGPPGPPTRYAVLRDKSAKEIEDFARRHPRVFVFPFATGTPEETHDYSSLEPPPDNPLLDSAMPEHRHYIVMPMYVGNFVHPEDVIRQIVEMSLTIAGEPTLVEVTDDSDLEYPF